MTESKSGFRKASLKLTLFVFITVALNGCTCNSVELGKPDNQALASNESGKSHLEPPRIVEGSQEVSVRFINNPYKLNDDTELSLFCNGGLIYYGDFQEEFTIRMPQYEMSRFKVEIGKVQAERKDIHRFTNKHYFSWRKNYRYLYIVFTPFNGNTERVFFIPKTDHFDYP